ncbi:hypothetical protein [Faecalispora jeddahensis]|uniref:hypothetical protein n=1 Tax=Faecalispora jeddahensis TaxID=1414721 RepID=UPI00189A295A|nr:hypothetical protein [Faecalispora jeddahensis]
MDTQYSEETKTGGQIRTVKIDRSRNNLKKLDELGEKALKSAKLMNLVVNGETLIGVNKDTLRGIIRVILMGAAAEVERLTAKNAKLKESSLDPVEMAKVAIALQENTTIKKALRLSIENHSTDHGMVERLISYYIQQAEREARNE